MPYFTRESVPVAPASKVRVLSTRAPASQPASATPPCDAAAMESIVARASAVLDSAVGREAKTSLPWPATPGASSSSTEWLQNSARAILSSLGLSLDGGAAASAAAALNSARGDGDDVPALPVRRVAPGSDAHVELRVANDEPAPMTVSFMSTPLLGTTGDSLSVQSISFSPPQLTVPGRGEAHVDVRVCVPARTPAGQYVGLVSSTGSEPIRAVVTVEVT